MIDGLSKRELLVRLIVAEVIARPGASPLARRPLVRRPLVPLASAPEPAPEPKPEQTP